MLFANGRITAFFFVNGFESISVIVCFHKKKNLKKNYEQSKKYIFSMPYGVLRYCCRISQYMITTTIIVRTNTPVRQQTIKQHSVMGRMNNTYRSRRQPIQRCAVVLAAVLRDTCRPVRRRDRTRLGTCTRCRRTLCCDRRPCRRKHNPLRRSTQAIDLNT